MERIGSSITISHPHNDTPHMEFNRSYGIDSNYVAFSLTNGFTFGLASVDLGNPYAYSLSPVIDITFNGIRTDGSVVSTTFTTPPDGTTTFHTFFFGSEFASGLASVEIPSAVWAMDNVVFVPEPGTVSLLALGLLAFAARAVKRRQIS